MKTVLVAGASGLVGQAALRRFSSAGWRAIGVSRRAAAVSGAAAASLDLLDRKACEAFAREHGEPVTHLVYAAVSERPGLVDGWFDEESIERNATMLRNLFGSLQVAAPHLEHVSLLQGTKAYGIHHPSLGLEGLHLPLREREPRRPHPNFYFVQEDYLLERQRHASWGLTIFRPTIVYGDAPGSNMNPLLAIGIYAALEREQGRDLDFPGRTFESTRAQEAVDCDLVADALLWAADAPRARDATFNITNGDTFNWPSVWPSIAESFGMEAGTQQPMSFAEDLARRDVEWQLLQERHGLSGPASIVDLVGANSLLYTDWVFNAGESTSGVLNSTIALRQAGFDGCVDTEDMFASWFGRLQDGFVLPRRP
jgi:nucleoside-diphosphate-sugar epimerase